MTVAVKDILVLMEEIAPASLAESWDNVGLQVGHREWEVGRVWVALDATHDVVTRAADQGVDLLITHHPLIFQPLKVLDVGTSTGKIIECALNNKVAIFCAHTNLDSAAGGVNDVLAQRLNLKDCQILRPAAVGRDRCKLVLFVPEGYEDRILDVLFESGAGKMEKYTHASFRTHGVGTFKPGPAAKPFQGTKGEISNSAEYRIEALVQKGDVAAVLQALAAAHPYEEMAYDIYETVFEQPKVGLGRLGDLDRTMTLKAFVEEIKREFGLVTVKTAGDPGQRIRRVALCGGSGRGLLDAFFSSNAEVFVTGDLGYHDGRQAEALGKALVDVGHFASEHPVVEGLAAGLTTALSDKGYPVEVEAFTGEKDCFYFL